MCLMEVRRLEHISFFPKKARPVTGIGLRTSDGYLQDIFSRFFLSTLERNFAVNSIYICS